MTDRYDELRAAVDAGPTPGPWQWWTSNSWKRLKHDSKGKTQNVIEPYVAHDGHPDLVVSLSDMAYIAAANPETVRALLAERDALRQALESVIYDMRLRAGIRGDVENGVAVLDISDGVMEQVRAALQSQDREDAEWMACESRRPWVTNSLKHHAQELRAAEKRSRNAFKKDYMGEPARYFADACGEAAALFEAKLDAIDHARRVEGEGE